MADYFSGRGSTHDYRLSRDTNSLEDKLSGPQRPAYQRHYIPYTQDSNGHYIFNGPVHPLHVIDLATSIIEGQVREDVLTSPDATKKYVKLRIGSYEREVFSVLFLDNRHRVIGVAEPSQSDRALTRRLTDALGLVDVRVLDHMVVGSNEVVSFAERGLL